MSSLAKLTVFLKENNHDIIDYWILEDKIKWIKIISRRGGEIYFVNVYSYNIPFEEFNDPLVRRNFFILTEKQTNHHTPHFKIFSEIFKDRVILFFGNEICESESLWFSAQNVPRTENISLFIIIDLDWFYDNSFVVSHEVHRNIVSLDYENHTFIQKTLSEIATFMKDQNMLKNRVSDLLQKKNTQEQTYEKCKKLYISISKSKTETYSQLIKLDDNIHPDDMTFKSAVHRQYLRKKLHDKMEKLENIQADTLANLSLCYGLKWNYLLQTVYIISSIRQHVQTIYTLCMQM